MLVDNSQNIQLRVYIVQNPSVRNAIYALVYTICIVYIREWRIGRQTGNFISKHTDQLKDN